MGIDLAAYGLDEPIRPQRTEAIESALKRLVAKDAGWTRRKLLEQHALGGRYTTLVGDPRQVADALLGWIDETGLDGFNLARTVTPECYSDFIDLVIPELQSRGRYKTAYAEGSFRQKLFGRGDRLDARHVGTRFRQD